MADERPMRYEERDEDGSEYIVYRASALGYCPRAFVALAHRIDPKPAPLWLQEAWKRGQDSEAQILNQYELSTQKVVESTQNEFDLPVGIFNGRLVVLRGHVDGLNNFGHVVEAKMVSDSVWSDHSKRGVESNVLYPWQASVYMKKYGELDFVQGHYKDGEISEVLVTHFTEPPIPWKAITDRVGRIEELIATTHYMDVPCGPVIYPCGWYSVHDEDADEWPVRKDMEPWLLEEVVELAKIQNRIMELNAEKKELDQKKRPLDATVRAWLDGNGEGGAEKFTTKIGDKEMSVVRTSFIRGSYVVPETKMDYVTAVWSDEAEARRKARNEKAAATRARNKAAKEASENTQNGEA